MPPPLPPAARCCRRGRCNRHTSAQLANPAAEGEQANLKPRTFALMILRATHPPDHRSAPAARAAGARCYGRTAGSTHPWPATLPRSAGAPGTAGSMAYTRAHPEAVVKLVDRAAGDRHRRHICICSRRLPAHQQDSPWCRPSWASVSLHTAPPGPREANAGLPPAIQARRHARTDFGLTRRRAAISPVGSCSSSSSTACNRTCSRAARPRAVSPPPSAYLMTPA